MMQGALYKSYPYTLAAGERIEISRKADFISCLASTAAFEIAVDNGDFGAFEKGLTYRAPEGKNFGLVALVNTSGAPNTITVALGVGNIVDARLSLAGSVIASQPVTPPTWTNTATVSATAAAATAILAANASRAEAVICNQDTANGIWLTPDNAAVAAGVWVAPLATVFLTTTAILYAYNPGGAAVNVGVSETVY